MLIDRKAVEIIHLIDYDFSTITHNISKVSQLGWIIRSLLIDKAILKYLEKYPQATIVNIGCGLDTTFDRIDNGRVTWYDLDLPDVIKIRRQFIAESDRRKFVGGSFMDREWLQHIKTNQGVFFIAAGVLYYFAESEIKESFKMIADHFPASEMVFDATSPIGVKMANRMVIKNSGMNEKSFLQWGLRSAQELTTFDDRIEIMDETLFFKHVRGKSISARAATRLSDILKIKYLIHIKFAERI